MALFDSKHALNTAIRYLAETAHKRAAGGWIPPKERERQQKDQERQQIAQQRDMERQQKDQARQEQAQQKQIITDQKEREKNLMAWHKQSHDITKNPDGSPKVFYHGTKGDFSTYDLTASRKNNANNPIGIYVTGSPEEASNYATKYEDEIQDANVMPVYVRVKNPFLRGSKVTPEMLSLLEDEIVKNNPHKDREYAQSKVRETIAKAQKGENAIGIFPSMDLPNEVKARVLQAGGYDGFTDGRHLIALDPRQIKSATGNQGTFDPSEPDITKSKGGPVITDQEERQKNFDNWFGYSHVVDENGKPMVLYHGTDANFSTFDLSKSGASDHGWYGVGHYLTSNPELGSAYSGYKNTKAISGDEIHPGQNVMPVYARLENPYIWPENRPAATSREEAEKITHELKMLGHDGVIAPNKYVDGHEGKFWETVVFAPHQIKSATGNSGHFDPSNPDITKSEGGSIGWSKNRLSKEIRASHYDDGRSKSHVGYVNPMAFLHATTSNDDELKTIIKGAGDLNRERIEKETQSPFLIINNGKISGHEGRHRMAALAKAGYTSAPVAIHYRGNYGEFREPIDAMTFRPQYSDKRNPVTVSNMIPLHGDYANQINDMMAQSDDHFASGGEILSKQYPTHYMPDVGRQVMNSGGMPDDEYRGSHQAPTRDDDVGAPLHDTRGVYPEDLYGPHGLRYYGDENDPIDQESYRHTVRIKGNPEAPVLIHRAIPIEAYKAAMKHEDPINQMIKHGDWVTPTKAYAKLHGDSVLNGKYKIASKRVKAKDVFTNGDSLNEWGYSPEKKEVLAHGGMVSHHPAMAIPGIHIREEEHGIPTFTGER